MHVRVTAEFTNFSGLSIQELLCLHNFLLRLDFGKIRVILADNKERNILIIADVKYIFSL
jgi:hypothetical protein